MAGDTKSVLLRLDAELADRVAAMAEVEGTSASDVMRAAIAAHVEQRRRDPEFQRQVKAALARQRRVLRLLEADD
jgi:predicted transcriptional regulator